MEILASGEWKTFRSPPVSGSDSMEAVVDRYLGLIEVQVELFSSRLQQSFHQIGLIGLE